MRTPLVLGLLAASVLAWGRARGEAPPGDRRLRAPRDTHALVRLADPGGREAWLARAARLRRQILAAAGLDPPPPRTPLAPQVFARVERSGYTVEKVYFESHPGFFVTGNLYRPRGREGRHPGIVSPHGHWAYGRLQDSEVGSVPARAVNLARQGHVVFTYDMIGYNDSRQLGHDFGGRREELWGVTLGGLQLWNSLRAVDFVASLPDVDPARIGATGASGGGTQTFLLMAVDERVKVGAPVNMVSAHMQGGCLCENFPGLRLGTSNVELAALAAPRPLLLVSATGDWTRHTPLVEFPWIRGVYRLLEAEDQVRAVQFDAPHNYNRASREAVYAWLGRHLLGETDEGRFREGGYTPEMPPDQLVFYGRAMPDHAVTAERLTEYLVDVARRQLAAYRLDERAEVERLRRERGPALGFALGASWPGPGAVEAVTSERRTARRATAELLTLGRRGEGDRVPATLWRTSARAPGRVTVVVHEAGRAALGAQPDRPGPLVAALLERGAVLAIDAFRTGAAAGARPDVRFLSTYNRTDDAERVQDVLTALAHARALGAARVDAVGLGRAGLWVLLARALAPELGRTAADLAGFDGGSDQAFLDGLFVPGLRRAGDFRTAVALVAPAPLLLHGAGERFATDGMREIYRALGAARSLEIDRARWDEARLAAWLSRRD